MTDEEREFHVAKRTALKEENAKLRKEIEELKSENATLSYKLKDRIVCGWQKEDFIAAINDLGLDENRVDDEELDQMLDELEDRFDAEIGVNWNTLYDIIREHDI